MVVRYSDNRLFRIDSLKPKVIFIHKDVTIPKKWLTSVNTRSPKDMTAYRAANPLEPNDCLILAESLSADIPKYQSTKCHFREKNTKLIFGYTDSQNIRIAKTPAAIQNKRANPDVGDAYAIVRTEIIENNAPYHIAYVLFKDGNTNITMEADAGDPDLKFPIFDMYDNNEKTFHGQFSELYEPATTIVLKKR
jgi:hypothetical protein